jgi:hypothetical protein
LGFLGLRPFGRENPGFERWKSLDFLGFSRPNRAFSMGCAGFSLKGNFSPLSPPAAELWERQPRFWLREGTDWSWGKPNQISAFLQEIAA